MEIINPATEEVIAKVEVDTEGTIREKYERLRIGQPKWGALGIEERIGCIERFYHLLEAEKAVLAKTLTQAPLCCWTTTSWPGETVVMGGLALSAMT